MANPKDEIPIQSEKEFLRIARVLQDLLKTQAWSEYCAILDALIALRLRILEQPLDSISAEEFARLDFMSRAAKMESVKGAVIGLRLARTLPSVIVDQANEIRKTLAEDEHDDDDE